MRISDWSSDVCSSDLIFCVYAVMVLLFHDFAQPFTVLTALPLAAGGALGALVVFSMNLSLATLIGLLMLIGIVSKNSILLVEYAIAARDHRGLSRTEAILDACHQRPRPKIGGAARRERGRKYG